MIVSAVHVKVKKLSVEEPVNLRYDMIRYIPMKRN